MRSIYITSIWLLVTVFLFTPNNKCSAASVEEIKIRHSPKDLMVRSQGDTVKILISFNNLNDPWFKLVFENIEFGTRETVKLDYNDLEKVGNQYVYYHIVKSHRDNSRIKIKYDHGFDVYTYLVTGLKKKVTLYRENQKTYYDFHGRSLNECNGVCIYR